MTEDAELLRRYAEDRSEDAFAELVRARLDFVYGVALRQVGGDEHLAKDVTQRVFADLARKASSLSRRPVLSGWLYRAAQFAATDVVRSERRRRAREQEAIAMQESDTHPQEIVDWDKFRPLLEQVLGELGDHDRDAVLLRFFEARSFAAIGAALRLTEEAARKRVDRALDKLRTQLMKRGMTSTTAALAMALGSQSAVSAPLGLASAVTTAALSGAAGSGVTAAVTFMSITKLQTAVVGVLLVVGGSGVFLQQQTNAGMRREVESYASQIQEIPKLQEENQRLTRIAAEVRTYQNDASAMASLQNEAGALAQRLQAAAAARAARTAAAAAAIAVADSAIVYQMGQLDQVPTVSEVSRPLYPFDMRRAGISGEVTVSVEIDKDGKVRDAFVSKSTRQEFEDAALAAVKKWKFNPGEKGGLPVNVKIEIPVVFSPGNDAKQPGLK